MNKPPLAASAVYAALAVASFVVGYLGIHALPIQLGGDAGQYIETADALLGRSGEFYYYRSWGYPIFLIITGFPWHHNPEIVIIVQLLLGSLVPLIVGSTLQRLGVSTWLAISAAALTLISFSPVVLAASILSDEVSLVLLYFALLLMARSLNVESRPTSSIWLAAAGIGATFFALALLRPANVLLGIASLGVYFIVARKRCRAVALRAITILVFALAAWGPIKSAWMAWSTAESHHKFTHARGSLSGAMFFWNIYSSGATFVGRSTINPANGPCSKSIYEAVVKHSGVVIDPPISVDTVMSEHTLSHHYVIWQSMEREFGAEKMDRIFWCSALESIAVEPKSLLYFFDGMLSFFLNSDVIYNDGTRRAWPSFDVYAYALPAVVGEGSLYLGTGIKIAAFFIALATTIMTFRSADQRRIFAAILWITLLYLATVHVVFAAPHWRYSLVTIPGLLLLAALGVDSLLRRHGASL